MGKWSHLEVGVNIYFKHVPINNIKTPSKLGVNKLQLFIVISVIFFKHNIYRWWW